MNSSQTVFMIVLLCYLSFLYCTSDFLLCCTSDLIVCTSCSVMRVTPFKFLTLVSQRSTDGFWKSVAKYVPREPSDMRILNPYFIQEASFKLIGLPHNNGQMGRGVSDMFSSGLVKR